MPDLPTGTVTFLFTDIEGSTRRWDSQPEAMSAALVRHDALLKAAIERYGGVVFKTMGDAFWAAFSTAPDALLAADAAQKALQAEPWGEIGPIKVRMALHTGTPELLQGDYFGRPLNRTARLLSAGHGGQVLLSLGTQELVRDLLPPAYDLRDLGEHRLRDLHRPERIFQLLGPGLATDFAPLRTMEARPNNLPAQPTALIGREREIEELRRRLRAPGGRLITLTGPGGTGKTRLSLQVAAESLDEFDDGVYFVGLASISSAELMTSAIAQALDLMEVAGRPLLHTLQDHLRARRILLLLDNFEQVVQAAQVIATLLESCPRLQALVTSRVLLRVYGEQEFAVPPLSMPDPHALPPLEQLTQFEAVRLFIDRAVAAKPNFQVTNDNAPAVAAICHRLDGLPLAIELAAPRVRVLPPAELLVRLERRLALLTGGARTLPARQQTLRAAIGWSHDLLSADERLLFRRLAVFVGGATLETIESVVEADRALGISALDGVDSLAGSSLLRMDEPRPGETRLVMLETIREYAWERLMESGEAETLRDRHAAVYLALAERVDPELRGPRQAEWLQRLDREHDNLRAALGWVLERRDVESGLRLGGSLWRFWWMRGYLSQGQQWLDAVLLLGDDGPPALRATALNGAGNLAGTFGRFDRAAALHEQALALRRAIGDRDGIAVSLNNLGNIVKERGDYQAAAVLYEESLALVRELGDRNGIAYTLGNLGEVARLGGEAASARALYEENLTLCQELGDTYCVAISLENLGILATEQGDFERAAELVAKALSIFSEQGAFWDCAECLELLAGLASLRGLGVRATQLLGAADALRDSIGAPLSPAALPAHTQGLERARQAVCSQAFSDAWALGRGLSLDEAIALLSASTGE